MTLQGRALLVWTVILWALAGAAFGTLRIAYGQRPADVNIRWVAAVDTTSREQLERAYHLTRGEQLEEHTWGYVLTDVSTDNIRGLVESPAVADTHQIHRTAFRIWRSATRGPYLTSRPAWIANMLEYLVQALLAAGALTLATGAFGIWRARRTPDGAVSGD